MFDAILVGHGISSRRGVLNSLGLLGLVRLEDLFEVEFLDVGDVVCLEIELNGLLGIVPLGLFASSLLSAFGAIAVAHVGALLDLAQDAVPASLVGVEFLDQASEAKFLCRIGDIGLFELVDLTHDLFAHHPRRSLVDAEKIALILFLQGLDALLEPGEHAIDFFCRRDLVLRHGEPRSSWQSRLLGVV